MRQVLYVSSATRSTIGDDLAQILASSRRNNAANGITGLLWTDGKRFLQVLEGEPEALDRTLGRIRADRRHRALVVIQECEITERAFEAWTMALASDCDERINTALENATPQVRGTFQGLIAVRRAA